MNPKKLIKKTPAVSEVLGTILLLVISVTLFSAVYASVLSIPNNPSTPSVTIIGTIENNMLVLEHRGGDKLDLDSEILLTIEDGSTVRFSVDEKLAEEYKKNGWSIGERISYDLEPDMRFKPVEVIVIDHKSGSIVMMGTVQEPKNADISVSMDVPNTEPVVPGYFSFSITVSNLVGPGDAEGIIVKLNLPGSLTITGHSYSTPIVGIFDEDSGILTIDTLAVGESVILVVEGTLEASGESEPIQLVMVLDGSGSINWNEWNLMRNGIADALEDPNVFPHDGSVELTIVQFGGDDNDDPNARLELSGPVVITKFPGLDGYYGDVANKIRNINQMHGWTPMACGLALAADVLEGSQNYLTHRHVINIVTDGETNAVYNVEDGDYKMEDGSWGSSSTHYENGKASAVIARYYLLDVLVDGDEIDGEGIGISQDYIDWLKDEIVWPDGYEAPPFTGPGWVRPIADFNDFKNTIKENFNIIFNQFEINAELTDMTFSDSNPSNNFDFEIISPQI